MKDTKKAADFYIGLFVMALSVIFFIEAGKLPTQARGIGPGDYPRVICTMLFVLGLVQVIRVLVTSHGFATVDWKGCNGHYMLRVGIFIVATYVYYKLLKPVGFPLVTPVYLWGIMMLYGYKRKVLAAVISIIFSLVIFFLFTKVFMVMIPGGFLFS